MNTVDKLARNKNYNKVYTTQYNFKFSTSHIYQNHHLFSKSSDFFYLFRTFDWVVI